MSLSAPPNADGSVAPDLDEGSIDTRTEAAPTEIEAVKSAASGPGRWALAATLVALNVVLYAYLLQQPVGRHRPGVPGQQRP